MVQLMQNSCHKVSSEFLETDDPDPHNWALSSCFHVFLSIWVHLEPLCYCTNLMQKRQTGAINAKVRATMFVRNFHNECSRSRPLESKLMFLCVSFHSGAFGTVSLL